MSNVRCQVSSIREAGVVVLPTVLIFSTIVIGIVLAGVFIVQLINRSNFGIRLTAEASAAANAAILDIYLKLIRGNLIPVPVECNDVSPTFTDYSFPTLGRTAVSTKACRYTQTCSVTTRPCRYRVLVEAQAVFVKKRLEAVFDEEQLTGQIKLSSLETKSF